MASSQLYTVRPTSTMKSMVSQIAKTNDTWSCEKTEWKVCQICREISFSAWITWRNHTNQTFTTTTNHKAVNIKRLKWGLALNAGPYTLRASHLRHEQRHHTRRSRRLTTYKFNMLSSLYKEGTRLLWPANINQHAWQQALHYYIPMSI